MSQDTASARAGGERRRRVRLALSMGVVGSLVLGGCASIPTSGPVHVAEPPTLATTDEAEPEFAAPAPGASPEQIVTDFLAAGQGAAEDYAAARRYLAPELADSGTRDSRPSCSPARQGSSRGSRTIRCASAWTPVPRSTSTGS